MKFNTQNKECASVRLIICLILPMCNKNILIAIEHFRNIQFTTYTTVLLYLAPVYKTN